MAMLPLAGANMGLVQPVFAIANPLPNFGPGFVDQKSISDANQAFNKYFTRIYAEYIIDTTKIEKLVERLLRENDPELMKFVQKVTVLKDTWFFEVKSPLGQVLQELQNSLESPRRKLLPKEIIMEAEREVEILDVYLKGQYFSRWIGDGHDEDSEYIYRELLESRGMRFLPCEPNSRTPYFLNKNSLEAEYEKLEKFFKRIHNAYDIDMTNIEEVAQTMLHKDFLNFLNFVHEVTLLRDTFLQRWLFNVKSPLGQVLQEFQNNQENGKLLSKETFTDAEREADVIMALFKGHYLVHRRVGDGLDDDLEFRYRVLFKSRVYRTIHSC